jgi:hypothetical protein
MNEAELAPFLHYAKGSKVGGALVALLCFAIASLGFLDSTAGLGIQLGLAIPFSLIAIAMLYLSFRSPYKHAAIVTLRDHAPDIVWIYPSTQSVNGVPSQTFINFARTNGAVRMLAIGKNTPPEPLLDRLRAALPHATYGYTPEREKQFKSNAASLRRG